MSAQGYWNSNQGGDHHQQNYPQQGHTQDSYKSSYGQDQSYQAQQHLVHGQEGEQMNWGYGSGNQQTQSHYDAHATASYDNTHQYQSYEHNQTQNYEHHQNPNYDHHQTYDNHSYQGHAPAPALGYDQYQTHNTYDARSHSPQPPAYNTYNTTTDYNQHHAAATNPYPDQGYSNVSTHATQSYTGAPIPAQGPVPGQADGERGILGAIGGAAAGGFAGHKVNHGFIGALGGAYAGHKLEDKLKDKKKKKKDKTKYGSGRRDSSSSSSSSSDDEKKKKKKYGAAAAGAGVAAAAYGGGHGAAPVMAAGNFSASSTQMSLDRDYDLIASCATVSGTQKLSSISLDSCIGNSWGEFQWSRGGGFARSSRNIRLVDGGKVLEAELGDGRGGWKLRRLNLNERITNVDGDLQFLG